MPMSRRDALRLAAATAFGIHAASPAQLGWAAEPETKSPLPPRNRFPRMVHEYFVERLREAERQGEARREAVRTPADAEAYVRDVRARILQCFGPFPERTPLHPRTVGEVERDAYRIEKVILESRPGFLVTANLYIPKGRSAPMPGVVGACGHTSNGKAGETYQSFAQGLARLGYVCLIYDPIGQGERLQYVDEAWQPRIGTGTREHLYAGNQQFLVGGFIGSWRAWDGIRALDYLLTRGEVDPLRVGVTGNSGGGTMTTWLCGLEQRWSMAAPSCFVTTFRRNMENELPADTEQCPPKALALGLDHSDFIAALAPKPVVLLGKEKDYFDARGLEEAYLRLKKLYDLLGAGDNISLFIGPTYHGYSQENREAMYRWFHRSIGLDETPSEPPLTIEEDETLWCTPHGQVAELGSRTVFSFTAGKSRQLAARRLGLRGENLRWAVRDALKMPARTGVPDYRILRERGERDYPREHSITYAVETELGVFALVVRLGDEPMHSRLPRESRPAVLYVSHLSAGRELREEPLVREILSGEPEAEFFAMDVRGIGESQPATCGEDSFFQPYGNDYFYAIHSFMLDYPYLGQKTHDILRVIDWLAAHGRTRLHLTGKGRGALAATFAAVISRHVARVTLKNNLRSYSELAESEQYKWPLSCLLPGVLAHFDLPDCYAALESKRLRQLDSWGPTPSEQV